MCEVSVPDPGECQMGAGVGPRFHGLGEVIGAGRGLSGAPTSPGLVGEPPERGGGTSGGGTTGGATTGVGFINVDTPPPTNECDIFEQDCPAGEKCMPWSSTGGSAWDATRCSPIDPNPNGVGDPCTVEGSGVSGIDDCDGTSMCWAVDPETNMGTCIAFCTCSADNPICEPEATVCSISNEGVLVICLPVCNPLDLQACPTGQMCTDSPSGIFVCIPDASGRMGEVGDPCAYKNVCDPGLFCGDPGSVPGCADSSGCCSSFCTIGDNAACLAGQECVPWYEQGQAPDSCLAEVGACTVP